MDSPAVPENTPFHLCTIIESKISSRKALVGDIKSTSLFSDISEAESVEAALLLLEEFPIDACVLGPYLSPDRSKEFIERGRRTPNGKRCAFLAIVTPGQRGRINEKLLDGVIEEPYSKASFAQTVIHSIKKAAERADAEGTATVCLVLDSRVSTIFKQILAESMPELRRLARDFERGKLAITADRQPSSSAAKALTSLITKLLRDKELGLEDAEAVGRLLSLIFNEWFIELATGSDKTALNKLKRRLLSIQQQ